MNASYKKYGFKTAFSKIFLALYNHCLGILDLCNRNGGHRDRQYSLLASERLEDGPRSLQEELKLSGQFELTEDDTNYLLESRNVNKKVMLKCLH